MASRGVLVSYESVRRWCEKFGHLYAAGIRRRRARTGDKWHLDEVFLNINGERHYLWRAVDQNGVVLDILVQAKRTDSQPCGCSQAVAGQQPSVSASCRNQQITELCRRETSGGI